MKITNLSENLFRLRKKRGLSQEEFAEHIHISRQAVSKWERGEAYPDTENLIEIAAFYGVTLDELVNAEIDADTREEEKASERACGSGPSWSITVGAAEDSDASANATLDTDTEDPKKGKKKHRIAVKGEIRFDWSDLPYPIIVTVAYLLLGFLTPHGWAIWWTLYVTVPVYYSLVQCIKRRRFCPFAYPVFIAFLYLLVGMAFGIWHPTWIIFVTIPIYYSIASAIDRRLIAKYGKDPEDDEDDDFDEEDDFDVDEDCDE